MGCRLESPGLCIEIHQNKYYLLLKAEITLRFCSGGLVPDVLVGEGNTHIQFGRISFNNNQIAQQKLAVLSL